MNIATIKTRFLLFTLIAAVVTIPLSNNLNSIAVIAFVFAAVIQQPFATLRKNLVSRPFWLVPVLIFLWYCTTYFWDSSGGFTIKELERYTILLFLPAAFAILPPFTNKQVRVACLSFIVITIIVSLLCLVKAFLEYQVTGDYRVFFYQYLGEQMHLNAIFLSNYCLASVTWIIYFGYVEKQIKSAGHHVVAITAVLLMLGMILMLSSKLILFLTLLILIVFLLGLGYMRGFFLKALLAIVLLATLAVVAASNIHYLNWRLRTTEFKRYSGPQDDNNGIAIRLFMWETAADLISERPMTGYGLKGARQKLLAEYAKKNFTLGVGGYYHSHNQYIESTLMAGLPASILLVAMIMISVVAGIRRRNLLLLLIIFHFMIQSVFEATFEVQHELVFYIFFIFFFYYHAPNGMSLNRITKHG